MPHRRRCPAEGRSRARAPAPAARPGRPPVRRRIAPAEPRCRRAAGTERVVHEQRPDVVEPDPSHQVAMSTPRYRSEPPSLSGSAMADWNATTPSSPGTNPARPEAAQRRGLGGCGRHGSRSCVWGAAAASAGSASAPAVNGPDNGAECRVPAPGQDPPVIRRVSRRSPSRRVRSSTRRGSVSPEVVVGTPTANRRAGLSSRRRVPPRVRYRGSEQDGVAPTGPGSRSRYACNSG